MKVFQPFRLDTTNQCLWQGQTRVALAPKAFDVLRYLVEHAGRLVAANELMEAVWPGTHIQSEVLRKYILDLRKALGDQPKNPRFIETLPKRGYQFVARVTDETSARQPLAGRERALDELDRFLQEAFSGHRQIVFVTGEAGIGKTTLLDAFQGAFQKPGVRTARGQCVEGFGGKEAYYPVFDALGQLTREEFVVEILTAQAPTLLSQFPALVTAEQRESLQREILGATRERMVREICQAIETLAADEPLLLMFEDLHLADPSTLDLVSALARRRAPAKLMLVATFRPMDALLAHSPLTILKQDLLVHRLCRELPLDRLETKEIDQYLTGQFPAGHARGLAAVLHRHSEGNPLFMVAIVEDLLSRDLLATPIEQIDPGVPETLQQMLDVQFEQLSLDEQHVLKSASVAGRRFSAWAAAALAELDLAAAEELCEGLAAKQQFIRQAGSEAAEYEFRHAIYREAVYRGLPDIQRSRLHRTLAESIEAAYPGSQEFASELALHFEEGRDYQRAILYSIPTANKAVRRLAHKDAIQILAHALELAAHIAPELRAGLECLVLQNISDIHYAAGEMAESADVARKAAALAHEAGLKAAEVNAWIGLSRSLAFLDPDGCVAAGERAVEVSAMGHDALLQARAQMISASWRIIFNGWRKEDANSCAGAMEKIRGLKDLGFQVYGEVLYGHVQSVQGEFLEAYRAAEAGIPKLIETHNLVVYFSALSMQAFALMHLGWLGQALRVIRTGIEIAEKNGNHPWLGIFKANLAWLHLNSLDFDGALSHAESLIQTHPEEPPGQVRSVAMLTAGFCELSRGRLEQAAGLFEAVRDRPLTPKYFLHWYWRILAQLGAARVALLRGMLAEAAEQTDALLESALSTADQTLHALAWDTKALLAKSQGDSKEAQACVAKALAAMGGSEVPVAAWRVHATAAGLAERTAAEHHRSEVTRIVRQLANSFEESEGLRNSLVAVLS